MKEIHHKKFDFSRSLNFSEGQYLSANDLNAAFDWQAAYTSFLTSLICGKEAIFVDFAGGLTPYLCEESADKVWIAPGAAITAEGQLLFNPLPCLVDLSQCMESGEFFIVISPRLGLREPFSEESDCGVSVLGYRSKDLSPEISLKREKSPHDVEVARVRVDIRCPENNQISFEFSPRRSGVFFDLIDYGKVNELNTFNKTIESTMMQLLRIFPAIEPGHAQEFRMILFSMDIELQSQCPETRKVRFILKKLVTLLICSLQQIRGKHSFEEGSSAFVSINELLLELKLRLENLSSDHVLEIESLLKTVIKIQTDLCSVGFTEKKTALLSDSLLNYETHKILENHPYYLASGNYKVVHKYTALQISDFAEDTDVIELSNHFKSTPRSLSPALILNDQPLSLPFEAKVCGEVLIYICLHKRHANLHLRAFVDQTSLGEIQLSPHLCVDQSLSKFLIGRNIERGPFVLSLSNLSDPVMIFEIGIMQGDLLP